MALPDDPFEKMRRSMMAAGLHYSKIFQDALAQADRWGEEIRRAQQAIRNSLPHVRSEDFVGASARELYDSVTRSLQIAPGLQFYKQFEQRQKAIREEISRVLPRPAMLAQEFEETRRRWQDALKLPSNALDLEAVRGTLGMQSIQREAEIARERVLSLHKELETTAETLRRAYEATASEQIRQLVGSALDATSLLRSFEISRLGDTIAVDGVAVDLGEVHRALAGEADEELGSTIEEKIDYLKKRILSGLSAQKRAQYVAILLFFLSPLLALFYNAVAESARQQLMSSSAQRKHVLRIATKEIEQRAHAQHAGGVPCEILQTYRVVTATSLNVREEPSRRSQRIGELRLGAVVRVLHPAKGRDWTLVEWIAQDGEVYLQGWVFSRYLKRLHLPSPQDQIPDSGCP
jgi:hypothetical protein